MAGTRDQRERICRLSGSPWLAPTTDKRFPNLGKSIEPLSYVQLNSERGRFGIWERPTREC
eukprot:7088193-Pyramimonas_sp.AAC.1